MADPLRKTFDYLIRSGNPYAPALLLRALESTSDEVATQAVRAILRRQDLDLHLRLFQRYQTLPREHQVLVEEGNAKLADAVGKALRGSDDNLRRAALIFVQQAGAFHHAEDLLRLIIAGGSTAITALNVVRSLTDHLFEQVLSARTREAKTRINRIRERWLDVFTHWLPRFKTAAVFSDLVESVLIVGHLEHSFVRKVLMSAEPALQQTAWRCLSQSTHPGVCRLIVKGLSKRWLADPLVDLLQQRDDPPFVVQFLRFLPEPFSPALAKSLKKITTIPWLDPVEPELDWIPSVLQDRLVAFLSATGLSDEEKIRFQEWILRHGSVQGRLTAADILSRDPSLEPSVQDAIQNSLEAEDVQVQAWATSKLREQGTPRAFSLLIRQLDHPCEEVRNAAREQLQSVDLALAMEMLDELMPSTLSALGRLLRKLDDSVVEQLSNELYHPARQRRIRIIRAAHALGFHRELESDLLDLLADPDYVVQRTVIDVLADIPTEKVRQELEWLLEDDNSRIRDAAAAALESHRRWALLDEFTEEALSAPRGSSTQQAVPSEVNPFHSS